MDIMEKIMIKRILLLSVVTLLVVALCTVSSISDTTDAESLKVSVSDISYDPSTNIVSVSGTSSMESVNLQISGEGYYSPIAHFEVSNGSYSGYIHVVDLSPGTYTVVVFVSDGTSAERTFTVEDRIAATSAVMNKSSVTLTGSESDTLSVSLLPGDTSDTITSIQWSSSNNGAYVSVNNGIISLNAVSRNIQTVTATVTTDAGDIFTCSCDVTTAYGTLDASPSQVSMYLGDTAIVQLSMPAGCDESSWISDDPNVASAEGNGSTGTVTAIGIGQTEISVTVGRLFKTTVAVSVSERPVTVDEYTFLLKMDYDYDKANYGESNYSASDLRNGITLTANGTNAGEALESALNEVKLPFHFWTKEDNSIRYWVDDILGLGDVKLEGGLWKYWIQYQVIDGEKSYNQWSLGFYTEGGNFVLLYGITEESGQVVRPDEGEPEIPDDYYDSGTQTTVEIKENDDGSTTIIADSISVIDGSQTSTTVTTVENDDGSVTETSTVDVTNADGTSSSTESTSQVREENGSTVTDTTSTTQYQDANGNVTGSSETVSTTTETGNQTVIESTVTMKGPDGNISSVSNVTETSNVTVAQDGTKTTESTVTETVKDSNGNTTKTVETSSTVTESTTADGARQTVTETSSTVTDASGAAVSVSTTETSVKLADGSVMVFRKTDTTENGTTITDIAAGSISGDGNVHTTAESSAGASADVVTKVKTSDDESGIDLSKDVVDTAIQQQTAVTGAMEGVGTTNTIEVVSKQRDVSVSIEKESFGDMAEADVDLRIVSTQGSMTMGKDVLSGLSQKEDVTLSLAAADRSSMTSAQREVIEAGSTVVSLTATSAGQSIGSDLGGKVVVTVKHVAVDGKTPVAYYVDGDGNRTRVAEQHYDAEKEEMTMVLDHFSIYTIVDEEPDSSDGNEFIWYIVLVIGIIADFAVVFLLVRKV